MANRIYDPDADKHPIHHSLPPSDEGLRHITGVDSSEEKAMDQRALQEAEQGGDGLYNPEGDGGEAETAKSESPGALNKSERGSRGGSLFNPNDKSGGLIGRARGRLGSFTQNKWLVGGVIGGSTAIIALLILLVLLIGSLKVPNLAQHIAEYQFARVARNYSEHTAEITAEDTALSTADKNVLQKAFAKYGAVKDATWGSMWDKIDNYRPDKIVENMEQGGALDFKYERGGITSLWKKKLTAVVVNGKEIPYNQPNLWNKYVHPLQSRSDRIAFSDAVNSELATAMQGRSAIIRGAVAKSIRDQLDIPLKWWNQLSKFDGKDELAAEAEQEAEAVQQINEQKVAPSEVGQINDAEQKAQQEVQDCITDSQCLEEEVSNGGKLPSGVLSAMQSAVETDVFQKAVGFLNPAYAVGLPACLIYDGSLSNSGSGQDQAIDNTSAEDQRTFYAVETAADQQKYGDTNSVAVGAMNWKVGDITQSIPEQRASGAVINTGDQTGPQSSANGDLGNTASIFSFLPSPASGIADGIAGHSCHLVTNVWFGAGTGILGLIAGFFTGGTSEAAEQSTARALAFYLRDIAANAVSKKELAKLGIIVGGTTALTIYAKMLVAQKAGVSDSGLATGADFDNAADKGGNLNANETSRRFYGRPLTDGELNQTCGRDQVYLAQSHAHDSTFQRYFALTNPDSLATKVATTASVQLHKPFLASLLAFVGKLLNPLSSISHVLAFASPTAAAAASNDCGSQSQNYGIVQWGWSNPEENLIQSDPSYEPIENQAIIEAATYGGKPAMQAIADKYNKCWGYDSSGSPDQSATMGKLLSDKDIQRTSNGDIIFDQGLCAPRTLSYNSNDPAAYDPVNGKNDLIFRYRLERNYELTMDQLQGIQNAQTSNE